MPDNYAISLPVMPMPTQNARPIMLGSVPILYKNQPPRPTALGTVINPKHRVSKFASRANSSWSAKNVTSFTRGVTNHWFESSLPTQFGKKHKFGHVKTPNFGKSYSTAGTSATYINPDLPRNSAKVKGFDICIPESETLPRRPRRPRDINSERRILSLLLNPSLNMLRPGMVLCKSLLDKNDQIETVRTCRALGVGPGGFYQPVDKDGAKLDLQMMCLGLHWNPARLTYEFIRSVDGCYAPLIPDLIQGLAFDALEEARRIVTVTENIGILPCLDVIPLMRSFACIVNFYPAATGRLALHQDCSERKESLERGSPVISISVGDSAEFLYGDERDVSKAEKVLLESGDALVFASKSRHIYHGISSIVPNSAPDFLVEEARLRPGRLNLTFREP